MTITKITVATYTHSYTDTVTEDRWMRTVTGGNISMESSADVCRVRYGDLPSAEATPLSEAVGGWGCPDLNLRINTGEWRVHSTHIITHHTSHHIIYLTSSHITKVNQAINITI